MEDLIKKLIEIQMELKAPKDKYNTFGKYSYRSCESILEAVKPLCAAKGLFLSISDSVINENSRYYLKATASITDGINTFSVDAFARECDTKSGMSADQITGAASSYARKYALNGLFCIDDTKDSDHDNNKEDQKKDDAKKTPPKPLSTINKNQFASAIARIHNGEIDLFEKIRNTFELSQAQTEELLNIENQIRNNNRSNENK